MKPRRIWLLVSLTLAACSSKTVTTYSGPSTTRATTEPVDVSCRYDVVSNFEPTKHACADSPCDWLEEPGFRPYYTDVGSGGTYQAYLNEVSLVGTCDGPATPIACDIDSAESSCARCLATNYCESLFVCENDPDCAPIAECVKTCMSSTCVQGCTGPGDQNGSRSVEFIRKHMADGCRSSCN